MGKSHDCLLPNRESEKSSDLRVEDHRHILLSRTSATFRQRESVQLTEQIPYERENCRGFHQGQRSNWTGWFLKIRSRISWRIGSQWATQFWVSRIILEWRQRRPWWKMFMVGHIAVSVCSGQKNTAKRFLLVPWILPCNKYPYIQILFTRTSIQNTSGTCLPSWTNVSKSLQAFQHRQYLDVDYLHPEAACSNSVSYVKYLNRGAELTHLLYACLKTNFSTSELTLWLRFKIMVNDE